MARLGLRAAVLALAFGLGTCWDDLIVPPIEGKVGDPVAILFGQGASIPTGAYEALAVAIQEAAPFPLWFASPQCPSDVAAIPGGLELGMKRVRKAMAADGVDWGTTATFYAGHSLGGAMMPDYVVDHGLADGNCKGQVLMASFLTRKWKTGATAAGTPQYEFPVPTLTVGGEVDGLCRVTRIAEALHTQVTMAEDPGEAVRALPVTVVPGMNHYEVASGSEPPTFVAANDLRPEIDEAAAHGAIANDTVAFISAVLGLADWSALEARVASSADFVQPIVSALEMEGYAQFLPPCYCETPDEYFYYANNATPPYDPFTGEGTYDAGEATVPAGSGKLPYRQFGTCVSQPNCTGGVPWTGLFGAPTMAGASNGFFGPAPGMGNLLVQGVDSLHIVTEEKPTCHLPHIHGGGAGRPNFANPGSLPPKNNSYNPLQPPLCAGPTGCVLNHTTITQHTYENAGEVDLWRLEFSVDSLDTGFVPIAATEFRSKLKSRQASFDAAANGALPYDVDTTDTITADGGTGGDRCGEINQAAVDWAFAQLSPSAQERYTTYGQKLLVGPDKGAWCPGGPCWIWDGLKFDKNDANNSVTVQAVSFVEENYNKFPCGEAHANAQGVKQYIPCPTGFHYCKLLSPAKALEWMIVDGLKLNYKGYQ